MRHPRRCGSIGQTLTYEQQREANIKRNNAVLGSLGLASEEPKAKQRKASKASESSTKSRQPVTALRRSTRNRAAVESKSKAAETSAAEIKPLAAGKMPTRKITVPESSVPVNLPFRKDQSIFAPGIIQQRWPAFRHAARAPERDSASGQFRFFADTAGTDGEAIKDFRPNRSPEEVLRAGAFGGTYFREITSSVTGETYREAWKELPKAWVQGINAATHLARSWENYDEEVNKFKSKCGQTLEAWESNGWMAAQDPFGWFQW